MLKNSICFKILLALVLVLALLTGCGNQTEDGQQLTEKVTQENNNNNDADKLYNLFEESVDEFMEHVVNNIDRDDLDETVAKMPWVFKDINTFCTTDTAMMAGNTWYYYEGEFSVTNDSWHYYMWSHNISCDVDPYNTELTRTFTLENPDEDGYILFMLADFYYYMVEISPNRMTNLVSLADLGCNSYSGFSNLWGMVSKEVYNVMDAFAKNPEIAEEFLNELYAFEQDFERLHAYAEKIDDKEQKQYVTDLMENGYCDDPIRTYLYDGEYRDFVFDRNNFGVDMQYSFRYENGVYTLGDGNFVTVEWTQNIQTQSDPSEFYNYRYYEVVDPTQDAFIFLRGEETGYELVRIVAKGNTSVKTEETHPVYTKDEFYRLYNAVYYAECDELLDDVAKTGTLTDEVVQYLLQNRQDIEDCYWYGERLTGSDAEYYRISKEGGWYGARIDMIHLNEESDGYGYNYEDGVLTLTTMVDIVLTDNISDIQYDPYVEGDRNLFVEDLHRDGFVLTMGEGGYHVYYLTTG